MSPALARAWDAARRAQRTRPVALPAAEPVRQGLGRRPAKVVPFSPRPVTVLAPHPETPGELHEFVLEQFPPSARRLAR